MADELHARVCPYSACMWFMWVLFTYAQKACKRIAYCLIKIRNMINMHVEHNRLVVSGFDT